MIPSIVRKPDLAKIQEQVFLIEQGTDALWSELKESSAPTSMRIQTIMTQVAEALKTIPAFLDATRTDQYLNQRLIYVQTSLKNLHERYQNNPPGIIDETDELDEKHSSPRPDRLLIEAGAIPLPTPEINRARAPAPQDPAQLKKFLIIFFGSIYLLLLLDATIRDVYNRIRDRLSPPPPPPSPPDFSDLLKWLLEPKK